MNKYQEALKILGIDDKMQYAKKASEFINKYKVSPYDLLKQLIDQQSQPTISECIKEWEERGWAIDKIRQLSVIKIYRQNDNERFIDEICFYLKTLTYKTDFKVDLKTSELINKTLKALEEMEDE